MTSTKAASGPNFTHDLNREEPALDLAPIKRRLAYVDGGGWVKGDGDHGIHEYVPPDDFEPLLHIRPLPYGISVAEFIDPDAATLCVHAPSDLRRLVAEVENLREENANLRGLVRKEPAQRADQRGGV